MMILIVWVLCCVLAVLAALCLWAVVCRIGREDPPEWDRRDRTGGGSR